MCRIFGFVSNGIHLPEEVIANVSKAQRHGGPDKQSYYTTPSHGIGCNRLAITDPKGGQQPYTQLPGVHIVLNGEIYNHGELRTELEADGYRFPDKCDGTILPALYAKYGISFPAYLDGMFTIGVLDLRNREPMMLLITDTSGIKPVYYTHCPKKSLFAFATEIPALLKFGVASGEIWHQGIDHYLTTRSISGFKTLLKDVYSLPAGSILQMRLGTEPKISHYLTRIKYDGPIPKTVDEASECFKSLFSEEVRKLSKADANVCSVNSGGLDSSLITALLHQITTGKTSSFHVACAGKWPFDERVYAKELADYYNLAHYETFIQPEEIPDLLPKMVYHLGQPNCAPHALSTYRLFEGVSNKGFRVALTGEGSDELFCGHERMGLAIRDEGDWISNYLDRISPCKESTRLSLYNSDYLSELKCSGAVAKDLMRQVLERTSHNRSASIRSFEQKHSLPNYILHRVEPLAMASGVEVRVPFCQPRIIDFSWKLDPALFLENQDRGKAIVYGAAKGLIPDSIYNRPKQPFTLPVISLMQVNSPLMGYVKDVLCSRRMRESVVFDPKSVLQLIHRQETQPDKESAFTLWALTVYGVWEQMIGDISEDIGNYKSPIQHINTSRISSENIFATVEKRKQQIG